MGRAYVGLADDTSALFWNPAGMMQINYMQAMFQMVTLYEDYNMIYGGFVLPSAESVMGLEFLMVGGAGIEGRDPYNRFTSYINDGKACIGVSYAKRILQNLYLGLKGKYYMRTLGDYSDMALGGDVSILYRVTERFSVGWNVNNIVAMVIGDTNDKLLHNSMIGIAYREKDAVFTIDARDNFNEWNLGIEWRLIRILPLRLGVNNHELCFGGGLDVGFFEFDFAYVMKELGGNMAFSCNLNFGQDVEESQRSKVDRYIEEAKELLDYNYFHMAKQRFEQILLLDPERKDVRKIIARIDQSMPLLNKNLPENANALDAELQTWPYFKQAKQLFDQHQYSDAEKIFKAIRDINPNNTFILYYLDEIKRRQ